MSSRSLGSGSSSGLVPFMDLLNHDPRARPPMLQLDDDNCVGWGEGGGSWGWHGGMAHNPPRTSLPVRPHPYVHTHASTPACSHPCFHTRAATSVYPHRFIPAFSLPCAQLVMTCTNVRGGELSALEAGQELYLSYGEWEPLEGWLKFGFVPMS